MLPTEILRANMWRNVKKLVLIKYQSLRKRSTRSKLDRDKKSAVLKRKVRQKNSNTNETVSPMVPTKVKNKLKQSKTI